MAKTVKAQLKCRHDTAANWTAKNPVLLDGELGVETDTTFFKIGDGATAWTSLKYVTSKSAVYDNSGNVIADTYATISALSSYQTKLTFDSIPMANSSNPVTSDGIKKAIDAKTVDLSNYYTKTQVDSAISTAISAITNGDNKSY